MRCAFFNIFLMFLMLRRLSVTHSVSNQRASFAAFARCYRNSSCGTTFVLTALLICVFWISQDGIKNAQSMQLTSAENAREYQIPRPTYYAANSDTLMTTNGRFVLQLKPNPSIAELQTLREQLNLATLTRFSYDNADLWLAVLDVSASSVTLNASMVDSMLNQDLVLMAEPEILFTAYGFESSPGHTARQNPDTLATIPNDTYYEQQWALEVIHLADAWDTTTGSDDIIVAVLDSGAEMDHPDLVGNLVAGYDFVDDDNQPWDDLGHGTHVASVIGGLTNNAQGTAGINWHIKVMPIKVLDDRGVGSVRHIIEGIEWAVDNGADIINLSLGSPDNSRALRRIVRRTVENEGVVIIAASGNEYEDGNPLSYPAAYDEVVAVGATDEEGNHASFSSSGNHLDLAAPGTQILAATWRGSGTEYAYYTGTSMAAPIVSGVVGLMLSVDGSLSPAQISSLLTENSQDVGVAGWDEFTGYGIVDAGASVRAVSRNVLTDTPTPTMTPTPTLTPTLTPTTRPTSATSPTPTSMNMPIPRATLPPAASDPTSEPSSQNSADSDFAIFLPFVRHS